MTLRKKLHDQVTFSLVRTIADGGMGSVYEARQLGASGFAKRVAIKTILPEFSSDRRFVELFIQEAKLVADLVHENIVQIYQFGLSDDGYYIVMEYINGLPLSEFIRMHAGSGLVVPEELAVFLVSRVARGLAYAHSRTDPSGAPMGIVHRDVCPSNVMITTEGLPKLGDFGIAKAATQVVRTRGGKKHYMAPEQARGGLVDFRSDIYAVGMVLFELLALRSARSTWDAQLDEAVTEGRIDWSLLPGRVSGLVRAILERALQRDPSQRFASTDRLAYDLEYAIYHKGYGPTVVTLESYLRQHFPGLYRGGVPVRPLSTVGRTIVMPATPDGDAPEAQS